MRCAVSGGGSLHPSGCSSSESWITTLVGLLLTDRQSSVGGCCVVRFRAGSSVGGASSGESHRGLFSRPLLVCCSVQASPHLRGGPFVPGGVSRGGVRVMAALAQPFGDGHELLRGEPCGALVASGTPYGG